MLGDSYEQDGRLMMVRGDAGDEYGVEATFFDSPFKYRELGITALVAVNVIFDDTRAEEFVVSGLDARGATDGRH